LLVWTFKISLDTIDNTINEADFQSHIQEDGTHGTESSTCWSASGDDMMWVLLHDAIAIAIAMVGWLIVVSISVSLDSRE
jgi:hypothetical protein